GKIAEIDGSNSRRQRIDAEKFFSQKEVRLLIATDAASEGLNFQNYSHIVIHNELPWNPNRLEQRNGRVDRWGQTNQVRVYNMLYENTFAYTIFQRLQEKIEMIKKDLGSVSSVIGLTDQDQLNDLIMIESDDGADEGSLMQSLNDYFDELETKKHAFSDLNQEKFSSEEDKQINEIIDYSKKYLSSEKSIRDFIIRAIKNNQGHIDEVEKNIFRIKVPFRFRRIGIEDEYTGTFSREIACALNNKELNFFDLNHILVKEIVKIYRSSLYSGTNQIDRVSFIKSEKEGILYTFLVRYTNGKREVVEEQIIPVFINTDGQVEKFDYGMGLFYGEHNFPKEKVNWREIIEKYSSNYEKLLESAKSGCDSFRKEIEESIIKRYKTDANDLKHNLDSWFSQKVNSYKELIKRNEIELSKHSQSRLDGEKVADTKRSSYKGAITRTIQKLDHLETVDYPKKLSEAEKISEIKCDKEYELIGILICIK
ncbi:MAG: hypothetical protein KKF65_04605, partial [Nanoarchaeota archaeon]|nr:hypothetical protein [Nanoarchaeota archaeon]